MKKLILSSLLLSSLLGASEHALLADVQVSENLDRSPVCVETSSGYLLSWRRFASDDSLGVQYIIIPNGSESIVMATGAATCYLDANKASSYSLLIQQKQSLISVKQKNTLQKSTFNSMYPILFMNRLKSF